MIKREKEMAMEVNEIQFTRLVLCAYFVHLGHNDYHFEN